MSSTFFQSWAARGWLAVACLAALLGLIASPSFAAEQGSRRFAISALSDAQRADLWRRVDRTALFEAAMIACRRPTNIEARARLAVSACVQPQALAQVQARFRLAKRRHNYRGTDAFCTGNQNREIFQRYREHVDALINEARSLCQNCLATGICR